MLLWLLQSFGFILSLLLISPGGSSGCSHPVPSREQVLPPVSLAHPHLIAKRSVSDDDWKPLRFFIHYDSKSLEKLSTHQQNLIKTVILPQAVSFWSDVLRVVRSSTPIRLHKKCITDANGEYRVHYPDAADPSVFYCEKGCDEKTFCGDVQVPDEHLLQCLFLNRTPVTSLLDKLLFGGPVSEKATSGPPDGAGVKDADFVLYVSTIETDRCNVSKTVAYAAHCQQEFNTDRPIAGHANLCPHAITDDPSDIESILSTVKHEILHALGFSVALFAYFRDAKTGQPLTRRDKYGKPAWNPQTSTYKWDPTTVREIVRPDWAVRGGTIRRRMHMVVTPGVVEEVRKHFDCNSLEGAELENQGGEGTALTHWEKRIFENEAMTGVHTQNPIYSRITFALLEDTGWYKPNYELAKPLQFGAGLGCDFAMKSCKSWIQIAADNKKSPEPYCTKIKANGGKMRTECTSSRTGLSICNLTPYEQELPREYQNFDDLPGVPKNQIGRYGGSVDLADFCPFMQEFSWKGSKGQVRGSRCSQESNQPDSSMNFALEFYGGNSICLDHDKPWQEKSCQFTRTWQHWGSGCYKYSCEDGRLRVHLMNRSLECLYDGQVIPIQLMSEDWLHMGSIVCPACQSVCEAKGEFKCLPDKMLPRNYYYKEAQENLVCGGSVMKLSPAVVILICTLMLISTINEFLRIDRS